MKSTIMRGGRNAIRVMALFYLLLAFSVSGMSQNKITRPSKQSTTSTSKSTSTTAKKSATNKTTSSSSGKSAQSTSSSNTSSSSSSSRRVSVSYDASSGTLRFGGSSYRMVSVAGGTFVMGATSEQGSDADSDEKPSHMVTLSSFRIGATEVTQSLWEAVMGSNPSSFKGSNLPVESVSWDDCQEFLRKLNLLTSRRFRLPTEAEWEYAARGGLSGRGYKYSGGNDIGAVAWYDDNSGSKTHPVGTKKANELGLYDMSGNVWEWCSDWFGDYSSSSQENPKGPSSGRYRVLRGGGWLNNAWICRVSYRDYGSPGNRGNSYGLRLALSE